MQTPVVVACAAALSVVLAGCAAPAMVDPAASGDHPANANAPATPFAPPSQTLAITANPSASPAPVNTHDHAGPGANTMPPPVHGDMNMRGMKMKGMSGNSGDSLPGGDTTPAGMNHASIEKLAEMDQHGVPGQNGAPGQHGAMNPDGASGRDGLSTRGPSTPAQSPGDARPTAPAPPSQPPPSQAPPSQPPPSQARPSPSSARSTAATATMPSTTQASVYHTCPMHPEVHADKPGNCPICGMKLVKSSYGGTK